MAVKRGCPFDVRLNQMKLTHGGKWQSPRLYFLAIEMDSLRTSRAEWQILRGSLDALLSPEVTL